jgi:hypothetical protein
MCDPRGGAPPPKKRERRPAATAAAHLGDSSMESDVDNSTSACGLDIVLPFDDSWPPFRGPVVSADNVKLLIEADTPAWICQQTIDDRPDPDNVIEGLKLARAAATHIFVVPDWMELDPLVPTLAQEGARVLVIEYLEGSVSEACSRCLI